MTAEELKQRAAVVRDETTESANTAYRVGSLMIDMIDADELNRIQRIDAEYYDKSVINGDGRHNGCVILRAIDGNNKAVSFSITSVCETYPGLMTIKLYKELKENTEKLGNYLAKGIVTMTDAELEAAAKAGTLEEGVLYLGTED